MLVLHGCTQQSTALRDHGHFEPAAEAYGLVVALPQVPNGGVFAGCWDYYGAAHTRTNKHNGPILQIVTDLSGDAALKVDAAQIYIAGLSSGAAQAAVSACLAPDIFAGVGINAGPMVGTASSEGSVLAGSTEQGVNTCRGLSGAESGHFGTQLAAIIYGSADFIVARGYGQRNADVIGTIYGDGTALIAANLDVATLPGFQPRGSGTLYSDALGPRIQLVEVTGMGHAFPAGSGDAPEQAFIARRGPSWPMMLAELFSSNNRRLELRQRPVIADGGPSETADATTGTDAGTPITPGDDIADDSAGCVCVAPPSRAIGRPIGALVLSFALLALLGLSRRTRAF